jgi:hypothetical protein
VCDTSWVNAGGSTSADLSGLAEDTTYYWQVRAINTSGQTEADAGSWWSFTTVSGGTHFQGCVSNTGNNATVMIPASVPISDNFVLEPGDEIAIFNPSGSICAGLQAWTGNNIAITAWGDDTQTPSVDGLLSGEHMAYRIWDASAGIEYPDVTATYSQGDGIYSVNSIHIIGALDINAIQSQDIALNSGWNMVSDHIDPAHPSMPDVFAAVEADLLLVKNGIGQVYWPIYGINQIGNWDVKDGYQVYMSAARTLTITGTQVAPETVPINLTAGWNMIGYTRDTPLTIGTALATINDTIVLAKDNAGRVYWPFYGINQIGNMQPGQGYQTYQTAADTLTYPGNSLNLGNPAVEISPIRLARHFQGCASGTGNNMTVLMKPGTLKLTGLPDGVTLDADDEIAVFGAESGICGGALSWSGGYRAQSLTVWGNDEISEEVDGLLTAENLTWKIWDRSLDEEFEVKVNYLVIEQVDGDGYYGPDMVYILDSTIPQPTHRR